MLSIKVLDRDNKTIEVSRGEEEVNLVCAREYREGDRIILETDGEPAYLWLQMDDALGRSLVYVTGNVSYSIPFGEKRISYSPKAFYGSRHLITARTARDYEIKAYRNLAYNINDQHGAANCFPHASANVETRGEAVFAARNAIDGVTVNSSHGEWPYESWGINRQDDAVMRIDFGRTVEVDQVVLYTRADFPHDNWWKKAVLTFSDGSTLDLDMKKSALPHIKDFEKKQINWIEISQLIKSKEPSPFPALTQMEVYGTDLL